MDSRRWDKFRVLTIALIFSGALNIGLVMAFAFSILEEMEEPLPAAKFGGPSGPMPTNYQILGNMLSLSFSELVVYLTNCDPVEEGYTKRDLALSALVASHHFNLEKALSSLLLQKRSISLSTGQTVEMYPGMTDEQYEAIIRYAYQEKWPLTSKGLFLMLKKWPKPAREESLCEAFFATPEFYALQVLFQKTEVPQDPYALLDLAMDGPWDLLERFAEQQTKAIDLSLEKRRSLLFSYLASRSSSAAELLLKTDFSFAKARLADDGIVSLIDLLKNPSVIAERFCVDLLRSPRTDAVRKAAAEKLYAFSGESVPLPFDPQAALVRFASLASSGGATIGAPLLPQTPLSPKPPVSAATRLREHIVQEGENLWKISRQYKVKVDDLIRHNALEQERLLPGMVLSIPQGTGSEPPR